MADEKVELYLQYLSYSLQYIGLVGRNEVNSALALK